MKAPLRILLLGSSALATAICLTMTSTPNAGATGDPAVVPPNQRTAGHSYTHWSNSWWQWVDGIPASVSPLTDETGANCDENQSGPVWYLAGSSGESYDRACTVPEGKYLFFPLANGQEDEREAAADLGFFGTQDCVDWLGSDTCSMLEDTLDPINANHMRQLVDVIYSDVFNLLADPEVTGLFATVDGDSVPNVADYRFDSGGGGYQITLPDTEDPYDNYHSIFGYSVPGPDTYMGAQVGYYLMLEPLPVGDHQITFGRPGWEISYDLTVE